MIVLGIVGAFAFSVSAHSAVSDLHTRQLSGRIWGVTIDNVAHTDALVDSLRRLRTRPMARIVFDPGVSPAYYAGPVDSIGRVADIMGSPIDSAPPSGQMSVDAYRARMASYMDGLQDRVDLWEIGNEINGDWTGDSIQMGLKVAAAYGEAQARHQRTALTFTYSDAYRGTDREMRAWSLKYLSPAVRQGVDYVLISFYTDSARGPHPDWREIFDGLGHAFPNAKLGFGELGLRKADFTMSDDEAGKRDLIRRYYRMPSPIDRRDGNRYVGGYFWWTYQQDVANPNGELWKTFHDVIR